MASSLSIRVIALIALAALLGTPAAAHKGHHHEGNTVAAPSTTGNAHPVTLPVVQAAQSGEASEQLRRAAMPTPERLLDWLGRLHTAVVHFPLAFFPAALFTALVGRRRVAFAKPVPFLVVAGGVTAPLAMVLGWLDGGLSFTDTDPLLRVHRWLGTAVGLAALGLGIWAWKRPSEDRSAGMLLGLAAITAALLVQGWYGGAMVHGIDHLAW